MRVGPLESTFHELAGTWWADTLFMLGLLAVGVALVLGIGLRIAAVTGTLMMLLMWIAEWPPAQHNSAGESTMSTNPLIDYHVVYAVVLAAHGVRGHLGPGPPVVRSAVRPGQPLAPVSAREPAPGVGRRAREQQ